jgi:hypothetical protein
MFVDLTKIDARQRAKLRLPSDDVLPSSASVPATLPAGAKVTLPSPPLTAYGPIGPSK